MQLPNVAFRRPKNDSGATDDHNDGEPFQESRKRRRTQDCGDSLIGFTFSIPLPMKANSNAKKNAGKVWVGEVLQAEDVVAKRVKEAKANSSVATNTTTPN